MTPLARMLAQYWELDPAQAKTWWQALTKAQWSVAVAWRRTVLLFDQGILAPLTDVQACAAVERFLDTTASPHAVLGVVENLVREDVLRREDARMIETKILAMVDKHGRWL